MLLIGLMKKKRMIYRLFPRRFLSGIMRCEPARKTDSPDMREDDDTKQDEQHGICGKARN